MIGGVVGVFLLMIGWVVVIGNVSLESFVLFLIIFMWILLYFWVLVLFKKGDYEIVGVLMLLVVVGEIVICY